MVVTASESRVAAYEPAPTVNHRPGRLEHASAAAGLALATLVAIDGTPGWQIARVFGVAVFTVTIVALQLLAGAYWRGRISVLAGMPALAIAVGFGPHLVKRDSIVIAAASTVLAVASAGLIAGGMLVATRGRRRLWRVATGAVVFVATALVVFVVGPALGDRSAHDGVATAADALRRP